MVLFFLHLVTEPHSLPPIRFLMFMPLKPLAKILAGTYDFGVNIVMLINITITIDKTHKIFDLIYTASTYMIL